MKEKEYRTELKELLNAQGLAALRRYGRDLQLAKPTDLKKTELIEQIVAVLCGEIVPKRGNKGAPVKDRTSEKHIAREVAGLQREFGRADEREAQAEPTQPTERANLPREKEASTAKANLSFTVSLETLTVTQKKLLIELIESF